MYNQKETENKIEQLIKTNEEIKNELQNFAKENAKLQKEVFFNRICFAIGMVTSLLYLHYQALSALSLANPLLHLFYMKIKQTG